MNYLKSILKIITKKEVYGLVLTILAAFFIYNMLSMLLEKIVVSAKTDFDRKKRQTLVDLFKNLVKYLVYIIVILFILNLYGYDIKTLVAGLGIVATVLGLALQDTLKDIIGGINILMENYYVTGDFVRYNDFMGKVIELSLKSTKIKSHAGEVLIVSNRNINQIINLSQKEANVTVSIPVAYEMDIKKVEKVLLEKILPKTNMIKNVKENSSEYLGIDNLDESSVNYLIKVTCKQELQWQVKREVLKVIYEEFTKNKIKIPYKQIEVHNAKSKTK